MWGMADWRWPFRKPDPSENLYFNQPERQIAGTVYVFKLQRVSKRNEKQNPWSKLVCTIDFLSCRSTRWAVVFTLWPRLSVWLWALWIYPSLGQILSFFLFKTRFQFFPLQQRFLHESFTDIRYQNWLGRKMMLCPVRNSTHRNIYSGTTTWYQGLPSNFPSLTATYWKYYFWVNPWPIAFGMWCGWG